MIHDKFPFLYPIFSEKERLAYFSYPCKREGYSQYALPVPFNRFVPFQFIRTATPALITGLDLISLDDTYSQDLLALLGESISYETNYEDGTDFVTYKGQSELTATLEAGTYYLRIEDANSSVWYGELVRIICQDVDNCVCIAVDKSGTPLCIDSLGTLVLGTS